MFSPRSGKRPVSLSNDIEMISFSLNFNTFFCIDKNQWHKFNNKKKGKKKARARVKQIAFTMDSSNNQNLLLFPLCMQCMVCAGVCMCRYASFYSILLTIYRIKWICVLFVCRLGSYTINTKCCSGKNTYVDYFIGSHTYAGYVRKNI